MFLCFCIHDDVECFDRLTEKVYDFNVGLFVQAKHSLLSHTARAMAISWSPDSKLIVSGSIDTNLCVWDAGKGDKIQMIKGKVGLFVGIEVPFVPQSVGCSDLRFSAVAGTHLGLKNQTELSRLSLSPAAAHPLSVITGVSWINNTTFASCAHDCCIRIWEYIP